MDVTICVYTLNKANNVVCIIHTVILYCTYQLYDSTYSLKTILFCGTENKCDKEYD